MIFAQSDPLPYISRRCLGSCSGSANSLLPPSKPPAITGPPASGDCLPPAGAYTNARTVKRDSVFELDFHLERLSNSVKLMMFAEEVVVKGPGAPAISTPEGLRELVLPEVRRRRL